MDLSQPAEPKLKASASAELSAALALAKAARPIPCLGRASPFYSAATAFSPRAAAAAPTSLPLPLLPTPAQAQIQALGLGLAGLPRVRVEGRRPRPRPCPPPPASESLWAGLDGDTAAEMAAAAKVLGDQAQLVLSQPPHQPLVLQNPHLRRLAGSHASTPGSAGSGSPRIGPFPGRLSPAPQAQRRRVGRMLSAFSSPIPAWRLPFPSNSRAPLQRAAAFNFSDARDAEGGGLLPVSCCPGFRRFAR